MFSLLICDLVHADDDDNLLYLRTMVDLACAFYELLFIIGWLLCSRHTFKLENSPVPGVAFVSMLTLVNVFCGVCFFLQHPAFRALFVAYTYHVGKLRFFAPLYPRCIQLLLEIGWDMSFAFIGSFSDA